MLQYVVSYQHIPCQETNRYPSEKGEGRAGNSGDRGQGRYRLCSWKDGSSVDFVAFIVIIRYSTYNSIVILPTPESR
jgi:hypothetical protein